MKSRFLTALPVYNEAPHVTAVLDEVVRYSPEVLVVDDGSTDGTGEILSRRSDVHVITHDRNRGYGAGLKSAFDYAIVHGYEVLVTIDCDGQHQPKSIPEFVAACSDGVDMVSGSRYLREFSGDNAAPADRRRINMQITDELNQRFGLQLTDAFCGFKAYRVSSLEKLDITDPGYAMPLELWVQAAHAGFRIVELPVHRIYLDESRSFGGALDDSGTRLAYYHEVIDRAVNAIARKDAYARKSRLCRGSSG